MKRTSCSWIHSRTALLKAKWWNGVWLPPKCYWPNVAFISMELDYHKHFHLYWGSSHNHFYRETIIIKVFLPSWHWFLIFSIDILIFNCPLFPQFLCRNSPKDNQISFISEITSSNCMEYYTPTLIGCRDYDHWIKSKLMLLKIT